MTLWFDDRTRQQMLSRFGAFVITYNRPAILHRTLNSIANQSVIPELVLVVDNGNAPETKEVVDSYSQLSTIYHCMGENTGPAGAAAFGLNWMVEEGFDWVYWVDDDDPPKFKETLERLLNLAFTNIKTNVGGVGGVGSRFNWVVGEQERFSDSALQGTLDVDAIGGNQQLIFSSKMVRDVGIPDPRLFYGKEELEYCLRVRRAGYRLLVDGGFMYEHRARAGRLNRNKGRAIAPVASFKNIWKRYYNTRNYIFMMHNTFQRPDLARREVIKALMRIATAWSCGPRYGAKFAHLQSRAILDGYSGRMGRTILPNPKY
jgi:GT2 family glycosyltransferase